MATVLGYINELEGSKEIKNKLRKRLMKDQERIREMERIFKTKLGYGRMF